MVVRCDGDGGLVLWVMLTYKEQGRSELAMGVKVGKEPLIQDTDE